MTNHCFVRTPPDRDSIVCGKGEFNPIHIPPFSDELTEARLQRDVAEMRLARLLEAATGEPEPKMPFEAIIRKIERWRAEHRIVIKTPDFSERAHGECDD